MSGLCNTVVLSEVSIDGVEDDFNKLAIFSGKRFGDELLSIANLLARGAWNPLADEAALFLCRTVVLVNEKLLCIGSVEDLFF